MSYYEVSDPGTPIHDELWRETHTPAPDTRWRRDELAAAVALYAVVVAFVLFAAVAR